MGEIAQGDLWARLPGVGASLARRIATAYGSKEKFEEACRRLDLAPLLQVEGLSERRAYQIVYEVRNGGSQELTATPRAREIRRDLEDMLVSYANTAHGKRHLRLLPVLRDSETIDASAARIMEWRRRVEGLDRGVVARHLQRLVSFREPRRMGSLQRILAVDDEDQEMLARGRGLDRWLRIRTLPDLRGDLQDDVLVLDATSEGLSADVEAPTVRVRLQDPLWRLVPEVSLEFVRENHACLEAMRELGGCLLQSSKASQVLDAIPALTDPAAASLRKACDAALQVAQTELESRLASLSLSGLQVLELLSKGSSRLLEGARSAAIHVGRAKIRELTGLLLDPFEPALPLRLDEALLEENESKARARRLEDAFRADQEAAKAIEAVRPDLAAELDRWWQFDVEFALGAFAADHDATPAESGDEIRFQGGANVRLRREGKVQPIDYELGGDAPVCVVTGANSGGKTSLLELVAQMVILHQWGLPVPAQNARLPVLAELHCVAPVRGGDAGAFEHFLRDLFPPLTREGRKLLLLDEVENVTELEAAGRILGVFIDEVARTGSWALIVTHLPSEVLAHARAKVRVDGIDAVGLDEKFNLIVDRQPKLNHWARSTPELILRRVHSKSHGPARELYERVLRLWETPPQVETRARR